MIFSDNYRVLSDEEKTQYKFDFCELCEFYECELVGEYAQFCESRQIHESQEYICVAAEPVNGNESTENMVEATAVWVGNDDIQNRTSSKKAFNSGIGRCLTYDKEELKDDCIMSQRYVQQIECGRKRVTEGIGDHYKIELGSDSSIKIGSVNRWEPLQPVFISAQTGQGKNYFIENELIPYVRELNYKNSTHHNVLILSNRLALKQQIMNRINGNDDLDNEDEAIHSYGEFADVMTYQSLLHKEQFLEKKQKSTRSMYIYIICDEAHFFTSDAMFNPHTQRILSAIIRLFQNAIRVYMSATPYECLEYIMRYENIYQDVLNSGKRQDKWRHSTMILYHFKRDYDYLNVKYYSDISELYEMIISSINEKHERWLIFIDDREKCEKVKENLLKCGREKDSPLDIENDDDKIKAEKVLAVNADSKKNQDYISMIKDERLNENTFVLITTSVLDNGINLTNIDNIVVSDMEKVKCLQMVGRARTKGIDDHKNLYIKRFNDKYVKERINDYMRQENAYYNYGLAYGELVNPSQRRGNAEYVFLDKYYNGDDKDWKDAKHWFGRPFDKPTELYLNEIAKSLLDRLLPRYHIILDEMMEESSREGDGLQNQKRKNHIGQKYLEHQLSWFEKMYCIDDDVTFMDKEKAKTEFMDFLKLYVANGNQIGKSNQKEFREKFTRLSDKAYGRKDRNKNREYSITKMNSILEEENVNYRVSSKSSYWVVEEFDWKNEESE